MSQTTPSAAPPVASMSATTVSTFAGVSERTATFAPSAANSFAVARPIPRPAPVMIATFPLRLPIFIAIRGKVMGVFMASDHDRVRIGRWDVASRVLGDEGGDQQRESYCRR